MSVSNENLRLFLKWLQHQAHTASLEAKACSSVPTANMYGLGKSTAYEIAAKRLEQELSKDNN